MNTEQPEKRTGQRIHTALPVQLTSAEGITRDVSASGVYFWTAAPACAPGELISFSVEFSRLGNRMMFRFRGDVVRTEPHDGTVGVAVKILESAIELA